MSPPREASWNDRYERRKILKLFKLPYGTTDVGRRGILVAEELMLSDVVLELVGVSQVCIQRRADESFAMMVLKLCDDFLISVFSEESKQCVTKMRKRFVVGNVTYGLMISFERMDTALVFGRIQL